VRGAFLLARGQPAGLALINGTPEGALYSFRAALLCLPVFILLRLVSWTDSPVPAGGAVLSMTAELVGFVLAWAGFALASLPAAEAAQRRGRWPFFVAAWNYMNVVQYAVLLLATGLPMLLGLPGTVLQAIGLVTLGYVFWLEWFVARITLNISGMQAAGFVLMDAAISIFVAGLVARLSQGG
jgi:hypothetical protein